MTASEWLDVMQQAEDYNPAMTNLIKEYGRLCILEADESPIKEDGEDELWDELLIILDNNRRISVNQVNKAKSKFHITRKQ